MPKFTVAAIEKLRAGRARREVRDTLAPGLHLIIQPTGSRSWALRFRRPNGSPAKLTLGSCLLTKEEPTDAPVIGGALTLRQARALAAEIDRARARGVDVVAEYAAAKHRRKASALEAANDTFPKLAAEFFADHKTRKWSTRPRRWREDARALGLDYPPGSDPATVEPTLPKGGLAQRWADRPITAIDSDDVFAVVDEARRLSTPGIAKDRRRNGGASDARGRKMHSALSKFFAWALRHRKVRINPALGVDHPPPPPARERVLSPDEICWFWAAVDKIGPPYAQLFKLLLLAGVRLNEAAGAARNEIGAADGVWIIPGQRTKNHRELAAPGPRHY